MNLTAVGMSENVNTRRKIDANVSITLKPPKTVQMQFTVQNKREGEMISTKTGKDRQAAEVMAKSQVSVNISEKITTMIGELRIIVIASPRDIIVIPLKKQTTDRNP